MEITNADPNKTLELAVNFNGLEGTSAFDISPSGSGSKVTWSFGYESGSSPLKRWKALALDGFIGAEYRAGLDKLKAKIDEDRRPTAPAAGLVPQVAPGGSSTQTEQTFGGAAGRRSWRDGVATSATTVTPASGAPAGTRSGFRHASSTADCRSCHACPCPTAEEVQQAPQAAIGQRRAVAAVLELLLGARAEAPLADRPSVAWIMRRREFVTSVERPAGDG